jgi:hypothetical protein
VVEEVKIEPAAELMLFMPIFMTAPLFGFVCGFLLHSVVG